MTIAELRVWIAAYPPECEVVFAGAIGPDCHAVDKVCSSYVDGRPFKLTIILCDEDDNDITISPAISHAFITQPPQPEDTEVN